MFSIFFNLIIIFLIFYKHLIGKYLYQKSYFQKLILPNKYLPVVTLEKLILYLQANHGLNIVFLEP